jgi:hypothetical protein
MARIIAGCLGNKRTFNQAFNASADELVSHSRLVQGLKAVTRREFTAKKMAVEHINAQQIPLPFPLDLELEMFLTVPTEQKASCQDYPDSFRLHRRAQFAVWSEDTLRSYLKDLEKAQTDGINLMTYKYARMDDLIPCRNKSPLIRKIVYVQYRWQQEMFRKYPYFMKGARPVSRSDDSEYKTSFETYLQGELETYSDKTLELLYRDIKDKEKRGINMSEEVYDFLVKMMGYSSLEDAEKKAQRRKS